MYRPRRRQNSKVFVGLGAKTKLITRQDNSIKSTSVPPRGKAQEPSMQLLAFHLDRANRLLEQTKTLYTAAHRGRCDGGNGKNSLAGRVSPSGDL